jgi:hypothetical protein
VQIPQCERRFDWLFVPIQAELLTAEGVVRDALIAHCRENHENHPKKMACDPAVLLSDGSIRGRSRVLELDFYPRSTHGQPAPLLLNLDDRLARIESLLVTWALVLIDWKDSRCGLTITRKSQSRNAERVSAIPK